MYAKTWYLDSILDGLWYCPVKDGLIVQENCTQRYSALKKVWLGHQAKDGMKLIITFELERQWRASFNPKIREILPSSIILSYTVWWHYLFPLLELRKRTLSLWDREFAMHMDSDNKDLFKQSTFLRSIKARRSLQTICTRDMMRLYLLEVLAYLLTTHVSLPTTRTAISTSEIRIDLPIYGEWELRFFAGNWPDQSKRLALEGQT